MLMDSFGRIHDYLRISLTDVCNLRCNYCMPDDDYHFMHSDKLMKADEIFQLASVFVSLGIKKIRLTGGEPLVRKDAGEIIEKLASLPVALTITTNGTRLHEHLDKLIKANIQSINISLDTLDGPSIILFMCVLLSSCRFQEIIGSGNRYLLGRIY